MRRLLGKRDTITKAGKCASLQRQLPRQQRKIPMLNAATNFTSEAEYVTLMDVMASMSTVASPSRNVQNLQKLMARNTLVITRVIHTATCLKAMLTICASQIRCLNTG